MSAGNGPLPGGVRITAGIWLPSRDVIETTSAGQAFSETMGRMIGVSARIAGMVVQLQPLLAAVPLGIAPALGANGPAHRAQSELLGRGLAAAADFGEGRPLPRPLRILQQRHTAGPFQPGRLRQATQ